MLKCEFVYVLYTNAFIVRVYVCASVCINNKWQNPSSFGGASVAVATVSAFTTCRCCYTLVASNSSRPTV